MPVTPKKLYMSSSDWDVLNTATEVIKGAEFLKRTDKKNSHVCEGCAKCCYQVYDYLDVEIDPIMDTSIPESLWEERAGGPHGHHGRWMRRTEDGACLALDQSTKKCIIYETRPLECRAFVVHNPVCKLLRGPIL